MAGENSWQKAGAFIFYCACLLLFLSKVCCSAAPVDAPTSLHLELEKSQVSFRYAYFKTFHRSRIKDDPLNASSIVCRV